MTPSTPKGSPMTPSTPLETPLEEAKARLIDTAASLAAAISLLERGGKKAAASNKMFAVMLSDYRASLERTRAYLTALEASPSPGVGWSVPDGWKIVPLEPTDEMLHNTVDERGTMRILEFTTPEERSMGFFIPRYDWRAMIAAAPLPPPVQGGE